MKKFAFLFLLMPAGIIVKAQVKGIAIDIASKEPIDGATIGLVLKEKPADTTYIFTNEKGEFIFYEVPATNFYIIVTSIGYASVAKFIPVKHPDKTINIGVLLLTASATTLNEITVTSAPVVIKEDTVEYRADAFATKQGAVVEDLLKKLPGIQVDKDGNVIAQGKAVTRVRVNGKDFFSGDVQTATKGLPANIVDKIQVIDDYGDQAAVSGIKEGNPEKIINVELKKDKNNGFFGSAAVGSGTAATYQGSFNGNYFKDKTQISLYANSNNTNTSSYDFSGNPGIGLGGGNGLGASSNNTNGAATTNSFGINYRSELSKQVSLYGSYSYNHLNTTKEQFTSRTIEQNVNNENQNSISLNNNHSASFNIEYKIDSFNNIKLSPNFSHSSSDNTNNTSLDYKLLGGTPTLTGNNTTLSNSKTPTIGINFLYNHTFRKRGRNFSASLNAGNSAGNAVQNITGLSRIYFPPAGYENMLQYIDQDNNNYNYGARFTYSEPLTKYSKVEVSVSHNLNYSRNNRQAFTVDSLTKNRTLNNMLSNDYENNFYNNRVGVSVRTGTKKYNYNLGISVQPVDFRGKSITKDSAYKNITRVNVFPVARFVYNFSRSTSVSINYNGMANQPAFSQLQPVTDSSNPQHVIKGNPFLKPSIKHNINLSFNKFDVKSGIVFFSNLIFATIKNQIVNSMVLDTLGKQTSSPQNVNGFYNVAGFYSFNKPFKNRRYVVTLNGSAAFNHNIDIFNASPIVGENWVVNQGLLLEFNHKDLVELGAGINFSLNDVNYKKAANATLTNLNNASSSACNFTQYGDINLTSRLVLKYNVDYTINNGLSAAVSSNPVIINASLEQQFFKNKNGILRLSAFDILKQNINISRSFDGAAVTDARANRLPGYFMLSFTYRFQKFAGQ